MKEYEEEAYAFWTKDILGNKIGDYYHIKKDLGYD